MNAFLRFVSIALATTLACAAEAPLREIEFYVYGQYSPKHLEYVPVDVAELESGTAAIDPIPLRFHPAKMPGPHRFIGTDQLAFYDARDGKLAARVRIPNHSDEWLFIFVRNPRATDPGSDEPPYLIYLLDRAAASHTGGVLRFLNLCGFELGGWAHEEPVRIPLGLSYPENVTDKMALSLFLVPDNGKHPLPAHSKTYRLEPGMRHLMIFFPPVLTGSANPDVRFLSENIAPQPDT